MKKIILIFLFTILLISSSCFYSCQSGLDVDPTPDNVVDEQNAITNIRELEAAINGIYDGLQNENYYGQYYTLWPDLAADNLRWTGSFITNREVDIRRILATNVTVFEIWRRLYSTINRANRVIDAIERVPGINAESKKQYLGEARFLRALAHFDLVRLYAKPYNNSTATSDLGVPIIKKATYTIAQASEGVTRNTVAEVYDFVIQELLACEELLTDAFFPKRASSIAAKALLARVYLYKQDWQKAEAKATEVINLMPPLTTRYQDIYQVKNSNEAIFELQFLNNDPNYLAFWLFPAEYGGRHEYEPTEELFMAYQENDLRLAFNLVPADTLNSIPPFAKKYYRIATNDDNCHILRLAEQYLIRAEARAQQNNLSGALEDLNAVRLRAGLQEASADTQAEVLRLVEKERQCELAFEGHRWFDLVRTGRAEEVLGISPQERFRLVFPIPQAEIVRNPKLVQNPGY
ncbi:MAG: RagB/SusD family nutrient uptake outer membrane protein [Bacteroidia bacterium]|nr:RagB/SusD family nutrient uptake outer membrane protein [Bacteroidia bacterium]MDW8159105.1 RagB/SusD family nutrient uptake outer membrane protein [Bacteroidia bacterium]